MQFLFFALFIPAVWGDTLAPPLIYWEDQRMPNPIIGRQSMSASELEFPISEIKAMRMHPSQEKAIGLKTMLGRS